MLSLPIPLRLLLAAQSELVTGAAMDCVTRPPRGAVLSINVVPLCFEAFVTLVTLNKRRFAL